MAASRNRLVIYVLLASCRKSTADCEARVLGTAITPSIQGGLTFGFVRPPLATLSSGF